MYRPLILALLLILPAVPHAQDQKDQDKKVPPIEVLQVKRTEEVIYEKEIHPIFVKKCITCHSGSIKEGRFDISTYEGVMKGGKSGTSVVPGKKESSRLYKLSGRTSKPYMPPPKEENQPPLSPEELALIGLWIEQGAKAPKVSLLRPDVVLSLPPPGVNPSRAVAVSPDKMMIAGSRGNQIHVYDGSNGNYLRSLFDGGLKVANKPVKAAHISLVESLAFSPDSKYLVSGSFREISIWDAQTGALQHKITGFAHEVISLAFSRDGQILATGGGAPTEDGEIKFFEAGTWKQIGEIKAGHSDAVYGLSFSPPEVEITISKKEKMKLGLMIATCSADKFIKIWEVPSGKYIKTFEGHTHHVLDVAWSADGKILASASADNTVKIWNFDQGNQARTIKAHDKQVSRLQFIGAKDVLTCGGDAQVKIFDSAKGGTLKTFTGGSDFLHAIAASSDGSFVVSGGEEGIVRVYDRDSGMLLRELVPPGVTLPPMKPEEKKKKE